MTNVSSISDVVNRAQTLLKNKKPIIVALDGRSGAGKSTVAQKLASELDAVVIKADDFYIGPPDGDEKNWHKKSAEEKIDQVLDYQRLRLEVLQPLLGNKDAKYKPFNFELGHGLSEKSINLSPSAVIIVDGVYSAEKMKDVVDVSVLIEYPNKDRRKRLLSREGDDFISEWHSIWDEAEDYYFSSVRPRDTYDFILLGEV